MNRKELKEKAKAMIKGYVWDLVLPFVIVSLINSLIGTLFGVNSDNIYVSTSAQMLSTIITLPLSFGATAYVMKFVRGEECDIKGMFQYYKMFGPIFGVWFLTSLFSTLWALLLIIPGIIAALSYSMVNLLMIDGNTNPMDCIRKSKEMMNGYKMDYLMLVLSFFGWLLLGIFTLGILYIWLVPYMNVTFILYYEELKKIK